MMERNNRAKQPTSCQGYEYTELPCPSLRAKDYFQATKAMYVLAYSWIYSNSLAHGTQCTIKRQNSGSDPRAQNPMEALNVVL